MTTRRPSPPATPDSSMKLRQTQAEYTAARPSSEPGIRPLMSSSKMYVCRRCQANFKTGDGKPDPRLRDFAGIADDERVIGIVHVGYSAEEPRPGVRKPANERITVID